MPEPPTPPSTDDRAPIRVLVDAMSARLGGGLTFIGSQLAALARQPGVDGEVLASPWNAAALADAQPWPVRDTGVRSVAHRYLWEQTVLPGPKVLGGFDVAYFPANLGPLRRLPVATVLAVQDANYLQDRAWRRANLRRAKRLRQALVVRSMAVVDDVVLISEALRTLAEASMPAVAARAVVIPGGGPVWPAEGRCPAERWTPPATPDLDAGGYVLAVANDYRHKGLDLLVAAWAAATRASAAPAPLVICGAIEPDRARELAGVAASAAAPFHHLGPVGDRAELRWLVERAGLLASASSLEAFPLTPQEGGLLGCPLLLSDIAAHREVAGDRAAYAPVGDVAAWTAAIAALWADPPERAPWPPTHSWDDNAAALAAVLRGAARRRPAPGGSR